MHNIPMTINISTILIYSIKSTKTKHIEEIFLYIQMFLVISLWMFIWTDWENREKKYKKSVHTSSSDTIIFSMHKIENHENFIFLFIFDTINHIPIGWADSKYSQRLEVLIKCKVNLTNFRKRNYLISHHRCTNQSKWICNSHTKN